MFGFSTLKVARARVRSARNPESVPDLTQSREFIIGYDKLRHGDVAEVGYKNACLGELKASLSQFGVKIPDGFVLDVKAHRLFLESNNLVEPTQASLAGIETGNEDQLQKAAKKIRGLVLKATLPQQLQDELTAAYAVLEAQHGKEIDVAVRSSPTLEDIPTASLIGRQFSLLNIRSARDLQRACLEIYASLYSALSLGHCFQQGICVTDIGMSVGVQKMVRSDQAVAGVMCTLDIQTGFRDVVSISSSYGLGDLLADGGVNPDEFLVFKPTLRQGYSAILKRQRGSKACKRLYGPGRLTSTTDDEPTTLNERMRFSLEKQQIMHLAKLAVAIEQHHYHMENRSVPLEIEWAQDGDDGDFYILQVRPDSIQSHLRGSKSIDYKLLEDGWALATGSGVGHRIVAGKARVATTLAEAACIQPGEILIADTTTPAWESAIQKASALVTNQGGRYSHAAMIAQRFDIPAVVGCGSAMDIESGSDITVVCIERDVGYVYDTALAFRQNPRPTTDLKPTNTRVSVIISNPERAFEYACLPVDGVGLAKMEYVVNHHIRVHPRALLEYEGQTPEVQFTIDDMVAGYQSRRSFYVNRLCEGISMIAAASYPKPVMLRTSDFRSTEYAALYAGEFFEAHEANPELGLRGAVRYFSPQFEECFALECEAIRNVREKMGLTNLHLVVPFVRTVDEGVRLLALMERYGLKRGDKGLRINLMCETPANALLADDFLAHFDGFSIGTDDLLQLTMGVERGSPHFSGIDESNRAVLKLISMAIKACLAHGKHVSVCGRASSDLPEFNRWLVKKGVHEITMLPENFFEMQRVICDAENSRGREQDRFSELPLTLKIPA